MTEIIKNYILWPCLAILSSMAIYLILVLSTHKILTNSSLISEEILWKIISKTSVSNHYNSKYTPDEISSTQSRIQALVDDLPLDYKHYPHPEIIISQDDRINAFAAPGNRIILTLGLLENLKTENALLFVIGHEIIHLGEKDHLYEYARIIVSGLYGIITRSSLLAELFLLVDNIKTQDKEFYADKSSINIMHNYYGHAGGSEEFFEIILAMNHDKIAGSIFSTHPKTAQRLEKLNLYIDHNKLNKGKTISLF